MLHNVKLACEPYDPDNIAGDWRSGPTDSFVNDTYHLRGVSNPTNALDIVSKFYVDSALTNLDGASIKVGTVAESHIDSALIRNMQFDSATNAFQAVIATKASMDAVSNGYVKKLGDRMSGVLDMGGNAITNLPAPATADAAATKAYADGIGAADYDAIVGWNSRRCSRPCRQAPRTS